jgi:predicted RND superfamily exporter protein
MLEQFYNNFILKYSKTIFLVVILITAIMGKYALELKIDASADTLLLKGDKDLAFTREIAKRFTAPEFLLITYSSNSNILTKQNIKNIIQLSNILKNNIKSIDTITNITNVPLLQSPPTALEKLVDGVPTLLSKDINKTLVKQEFLNSPIYKQNLVSKDFKTTAILLNLKPENITLSKDTRREQNHQNIVKLRKIIKNFIATHKDIELHLGGTPMIADDMVEFVKHDLKTFGIAIVLLLFAILFVIFRQLRWMFLPLFICTISIIITSGILAIFNWKITVISSNFISLQLIMNISLVVHLIVKYQELAVSNLHLTQKQLLVKTVSSMAKPSFFVVITTITGFSSLVFANILPVMNFGWMMSFGIAISLIITFILFPLTLVFLDKNDTKHSLKISSKPFTTKLPKVIYKYKNIILITTVFIVICGLRIKTSFFMGSPHFPSSPCERFILKNIRSLMFRMYLQRLPKEAQYRLWC